MEAAALAAVNGKARPLIDIRIDGLRGGGSGPDCGPFETTLTVGDMLRLPLPPVRPGHPAPASLVERRGTIVPAPHDIAGVPCVVVGDEMAATTLLHLHGGAFRQGSATAWSGFAGRLAKFTSARVVVPDYRLAPEHPFPAALHDCAAVLEALCDEGRPVMLSGDSAGGGLALSLAAQCASPTRLAGLALISPWTDLRVTADSFEECATTDVLFSRDAAQEAAELYLQGVGAEDPLASPHFADLTTLPPVLLMASTIEVLRDDATSLVGRLARAGRRFDAQFEPDVSHDWPFVLPDHPATARALTRYATFAAEVTRTEASGL